MMKRVERIEAALAQALDLTHLEVFDESSGHNVPEGAESHFKVVAVSDAFGANRESIVIACSMKYCKQNLMVACTLWHYTFMIRSSGSTSLVRYLFRRPALEGKVLEEKVLKGKADCQLVKADGVKATKG